jgi:mRNA interferase MazF
MIFGNYHSNICICVPLTSQNKKLSQPTHVRCSYHQSVILCEQIHTISQDNISNICYHLKDEEMIEVNKALKISIGVDEK